MSDDKVYKIWIEIEEYDEESGDGTTMDSLESSVATFDTYDEAQRLASKLQEHGVLEVTLDLLRRVAEDATVVLECNCCSLDDDECQGTCTHSLAVKALARLAERG